MVVEDGSESVISREDAFEGGTPKSTTIPIHSKTKGDNGVRDPILFSAFGSGFGDMAKAISDEEFRAPELDILKDETQLAGRLHRPSNGSERLPSTGGRPALPNPIIAQTWPRVDGINPAQQEFPVAPSATPENPDEMVIAFDGELDGPTRNTVRTPSASLSPSLREILCGFRIDLTEFRLARARNVEHTSCQSLWTGSTKDTESIAGYDVGRPPDSSDRTALGVSPTDGTRPEVRIFLVSEAENDSHFTHLDASQAPKDHMDVVKHPESPLRPLSLSTEKTKLEADLFVASNTESPCTRSPEKPKAPALERYSQDSDVNTPSTCPPSAGSVTKPDDADDSSDIESCEGDYWSDYTPDVPYMSDAHLFMQYKEKALMSLFLRFCYWPMSTTHASNGHDAPDSHSSPQTYREKSSHSRNKRARDSGGEGSSSSGSSEQDTKATKAKRPRHMERQRRPRLACPYYKKAPMRYYDCHSKIISSISHLKQHLSRNHQLPVYCPVCKAVFSDEAERDDHAEQQSCQLRTDVAHEGLTRDQKEQLKRRASPTIPEEQQWFEIFDILFPGYNPRPKSAYINAELIAETENYQDFERVEGPSIILDTLLQQGVSLVRVDNPEHDLGVFRENLLAEALALIARRWHESRPVHDGADHPADSDGSTSVIGAGPSTTGETLVELHDEGTTEDQVLLANKIVEEGGTEETQLEPGDMLAAMGEVTGLSTLFPSDLFGGQGPNGTGAAGMEGCDDTTLFQSSINWPDEGA
ncbi:hypothetical protein MMYC01_200496 [Madurella mycetomatis]|nr:hypothetical protein MMYC01_200496 [Madurella mycetomatis]